MKSNGNEELKNSMFENVFGYKSTIVGKSKEEEVKSSVRAMTNQ